MPSVASLRSVSWSSASTTPWIATSPPCLAVRRCDEAGHVHRESRDRFALFLIGWLRDPQDYMALHGHPRLRMRHGRVPVDIAMRDAWLRAMTAALDEQAVTGTYAAT